MSFSQFRLPATVTQILLYGIGLFILSIIFFSLPSHLSPAEDATILYRYSENVAQEGRICYNPGGEVAEGATDFLWMLILSMGIKLGIDPYLFSRILSVLGLIGSYLIGRKWLEEEGKPTYLSHLLLGSLLVNSQLMAAVQGFSVAFFGCWGLFCMYQYGRKNMFGLVSSALILGLIRPDGLLLGIPLVFQAFWQERMDWKMNLRTVILWGLLPGLLYFGWRWWYFGEVLPLPMYVKGGTGFQIDSLMYEIKYMLKYLFPLFVCIGIALLQQRKQPKDLAPLSLICILFPLLFYAQIRLEQNIADRFLYLFHLGTLIIFLLAWPVEKKNRVVFSAAWILYFILSLLYCIIFTKGTLQIVRNNPVRIAKALTEIPDLRMAVTEAGRLPYYSKCETLDLWGLNSPALAKRPLQQTDLKVFDPDLIVLDVGYDYHLLDSLLIAPQIPDKTWFGMVQQAYQYAQEDQAYEAWMVPFWQESPLPVDWKGFDRFAQTLIDMKTQWIGGVFREPYPRYHLYLVKRRSSIQHQIIPVLKKYDAISWQAFQQRHLD